MTQAERTCMQRTISCQCLCCFQQLCVYHNGGATSLKVALYGVLSSSMPLRQATGEAVA